MTLRRFITAAVAAVALLRCATIASEPIHPQLKQQLDSLEIRLKDIDSVGDSIHTLYALFDIAPNQTIKNRALSRLYQVAVNTGDESIKLDVLKHCTNLYNNNDSVLTVIEAELAKLPESDYRSEAELFLRMRRAGMRVLHDNKTDSDKHLGKLLKEYNSAHTEDPYSRAEMLFSLCLHLGKATRGELLEKYVDKLITLVESMHLPSGAVRNLIYTRAAPLFTTNKRHERAVDIDKKMLNIIDSLVTQYNSTGRPFRKMQTYRYVCLRRMLGNYPALSPLEIEHIHKQINELAKENSQVDFDLRNNERAEIFYNLATKQWTPALAMLKRQVDNPSNQAYRNYFLEAIVQAAGHTGDRQAQLDAALELNNLLLNELDTRSNERYRELQILYDINELRQEKDALIIARHEVSARNSRLVIITGSVLCLVLILLSIILMRNNKKFKQLAKKHLTVAKEFRKELDESIAKNDSLAKEVDAANAREMQKTDLMTTCSHEMKAPLEGISEYSRLIVDCIPQEQRKYLERFASLIEQNSRIINNILDDAMDINAIESGAIHRRNEPTGIYKMCNLAIMNLFEKGQPANPELKLVFNPDQKPDAIIDVDGAHVSQILMNLLKNAERFTSKGSITLDFDVSREEGKATFTVTDTGIGIPAKQVEKIFERFYKIDSHTPGAGLGLYISRMLARLLGGDITVDTHHRGGARFILTIAIKN